MKIKRAAKTGYTYDPRRDGVSQSMLGTWLNCREKARLNILQGWSALGTSKPFTFGTISHGVLERAYAAIRAGKIKKVDHLLERTKGWMEESLEAWREENPKRTTDADDLAEECAAIIFEMHPRYFFHWFKEDTEVEWMHVEDKFSIPIKMPDKEMVPMVGRFDGSFMLKKKLWLLETKNKSQWPERLGEILPLDIQLGYYLTALYAIKQMEPHGVRYNLLRRPGERRGANESLVAYVKRIGGNIAKKPDHYFQRLEIRLEQSEREEHRFRAEKLVTEFYLWWKNEDHAKRDLLWNSGQCESKFGVCNNIAICANNDTSGHYIRAVVSPELAAE